MGFQEIVVPQIIPNHYGTFDYFGRFLLLVQFLSRGFFIDGRNVKYYLRIMYLSGRRKS